MHHTFLLYISLIIIILLLVMLAERLRTAYPIVLVIGGLILSLIPGTPIVTLNPELVFIIFLPPLLYEAAWYTSWKDLWRWRRVIMSFAFLIVIVTSFVIALVSSAIIPGFTMALGFLLGGIISPPDAVSATTILKYVKVPKRISAILEGESLLNDASSLIVFRFALIAVDTGRFVFREAAWSFVLVIVLGALIGLAVAWLYYNIHRWLPTSSNIDVVLTLTAPYVMYLAAEHFHYSGVLAVVCGGLFLSVRSHRFLSPRSRLRGSNVWGTLGFVLNGLVFMLIGLELPVIVNQLGPVSLGSAIWYGILITLVLIVTRIICAIGASYFTVFISQFITTADSRPGLKGPIIIGWAGMRGVVSLAAALSIPVYLTNGIDFPQRNLILFITFTVILLTLVVQGLTLPLVIKWVKMKDPDKMLLPAEQEVVLKNELASCSLAYLDGPQKDNVKSNPALIQLRQRIATDHETTIDSAKYDQEKIFMDVYIGMIEEQRLLLRKLNQQPTTDAEIIRKYSELLDLEEEKIRIRYEHE